MNQLSLLPFDQVESGEPRTNLVALPRRASVRRAPRTAVGAPGYLSVTAAAERLGLRPRSVRYLIEHDRLASQRLGRMHFLSTGDVEAYRRARRARRSGRRSQGRLA